MKMISIRLFLVSFICFNFCSCAKYTHLQNTAITSQKCALGSHVLNDCNWCRCVDYKFHCEKRDCGRVDPFGHFNDAVYDLNVGMEGHGAWRSTQTACEPGVHYKRDGMLCICDEDGRWPNPTCRDTFRVLHPVEITELSTASKKQSCAPSKLYLIGCNVCFCPSKGRIDPELCTTKVCNQDDPVIVREELAIIPRGYEDEVYADCQVGRKYVLGCRICSCLSNNRLLCGPCIYEINKETPTNSHCSKVKAKQIFNSDCNLCYCENDKTTCTVRRCLPKTLKTSLLSVSSEEEDISQQLFVLTSKPDSDERCRPGTRYKKDCNTCFCSESESGIKTLTCTVKQCDVSLDRSLKNDCVQDSVYGIDCLICTCIAAKGEKKVTCKVDPKCLINKLPEPKEVTALNGHCKTGKNYRNGCNNCTCLSNKRLVSCTSQVCEARREKEMIYGDEKMFRTVDIIPVKSKFHTDCPPGHSYKIDCNHCFCMKNGNILCTKADCSKRGS